MQEEIEHKTVNFAISTTKLSARTLLHGMQFLLRQYDKHASQGKQSMKRLVRQNRGVTNVEIQKTGMEELNGQYESAQQERTLYQAYHQWSGIYRTDSFSRRVPGKRTGKSQKNVTF